MAVADAALPAVGPEAEKGPAAQPQPSPVDAHKKRGNELLKAGQAAEAAEAYGQAIELDPLVAALYSNRSHARLKSGDAAGALQDAEEAVRLEPEWPKGHLRRVRALEALGRLIDAASACSPGEAAAAASKLTSEAREFGRLRSELSSAAAEVALQGWWHGTVSAALGGYCQEFNFGASRTLECSVYDKPLSGQYFAKDIEVLPSGGFRGGLDVSLDGNSIPYLFRVNDGDCKLHLCCPMQRPERPRTFDGPGYVAMRRGRERDGKADAPELTEGQRVLLYLAELCEIVESQEQVSSSSTAAAAMAERIEEDKALGDTIFAGELSGPETIENKEKKMAYTQRLSALELKYSTEVAEAAQRLVQGKEEACVTYPVEARELERQLRPFKRRVKEAAAEAAEDEGEEAEAPAALAIEAPAAAVPAAAAQEPSAPAPAATLAATPTPPESAMEASAMPVSTLPAKAVAATPAGGCLAGCLVGISKH